MTITSINTLEISFLENPRHDVEALLLKHIEQLNKAQGCLSYALSRSTKSTARWIVSGYWSNEGHMTDHFCTAAMTEFIDELIEAEANIAFARFAANIDITA